MKLFHVIIALFVAISLSACSSSAGSPQEKSFVLTSTAFANEGDIPDQYAYILSGQCNGENISVPLSWSGAPAGTKSFALIMSDPDGQNWGHWVQYNIPADVGELPETAGGPDIGVKGQNDFGRRGYGGPCPPSGIHHYLFTLYAVDMMLDLEQGAYDYELEIALEGHVLAQAQLTGLRSGD